MKTFYIVGAVVATVAVGAAGYGAYRMIRAKTIAEQNRRMDGPTPDRPNVDMTSGPVITRGVMIPPQFTVPVIRRRMSTPVTNEVVVENAETVDPEPSQGPRSNLLMLR